MMEEAIAAIVDLGLDVDEVLRMVVETLVEGGCASWAGILFAEGADLVLGPSAGTPNPGARVQVPVVFEGNRVAKLVVDGCTDSALLDFVADAIAALCLVGWDTGGEVWEP